MTNDLGVWTSDDGSLVLIDYQNEVFEVIRSDTSADLVEMHVRLLARTRRSRRRRCRMGPARTEARELAASRMTRAILDTKEMFA